MQKSTILKAGGAIAAAAGITLGGAALANADQSPTPTPSTASTATQSPGQRGAGGDNHVADKAAHQALLLSGDTAVKVTQAATTKESTAKLERVAGDPAGGFTARMVRTDGTHIVLHIDASFTVTSDETAPQPAPPGDRHGKGHRESPERPGQPAQPAQPGPTAPAPPAPAPPAPAPTGTAPTGTAPTGTATGS